MRSVISARLRRTGGDPAWGPHGSFQIMSAQGRLLTIIASDAKDKMAQGWEHVSVSLQKHPMKVPNWYEMCLVKSLFWKDEETVLQFHPAKTDYVNVHPGVLHLWRHRDRDIPTPPKELIA